MGLKKVPGKGQMWTNKVTGEKLTVEEAPRGEPTVKVRPEGGRAKVMKRDALKEQYERVA